MCLLKLRFAFCLLFSGCRRAGSGGRDCGDREADHQPAGEDGIAREYIRDVIFRTMFSASWHSRGRWLTLEAFS